MTTRRALSTRRLLRRRLATDRVVAVTILLVTLATAAVLAAIPRHVGRVAEESLREDIATAGTRERGAAVVHTTRVRVAPGQVAGPIEELGETYRAQLPPALQDLLGEMRWIVDTGAYRASAGPGGPPLPTARTVTLRVQPGAQDHATLVEGRWPQVRSEVVELDVAVAAAQVAILLEVAISTETAAALGSTVGERMSLAPIATDGTIASVSPRARLPAVIEIVGVFEPTPLDEDPFWYGDGRVHTPGIQRDPITGTTIFPVALLAVDAYDELPGARLGANVRHEWRFEADTAGLTTDDVPDLVRALRENTQLQDPRGPLPPGPILQSGLDGLLARHLERAAAGDAVLTVGVVGLLALSVSVVGLAAALLARRRAGATALLRGRGATATQLSLWQFREGAAVAVPGTVLGFAAAQAVPGPNRPVSLLLAVLVGAGTVLAVVAVSLPSARTELRTLLRSEDAVARPSRGRRIVEALLLVLAVVAVALARTRGANQTGQIDPFLAATPVLLTVAAALVTARLYLLPARALAARAAARRGAVAVTAFRQGARQASFTTAPLTVLLLAVSVAVFAAATLDTVRAGQVITSWERVAGAARIDQVTGTASPVDLATLEELPHADAAIVGLLVEGQQGRARTVPLAALDVDAFERVTSASPLPGALPAALRGDSPGGEGAEALAVPALAVGPWGGDLPGDGLVRGAALGSDVLLRVVERRDRVPGLDPSVPALVVDIGHLELAASRPFVPNTAFVDDVTEADLEALRGEIAGAGGGLELTRRIDVLADLTDDRMIAGTLLAFVAIVLLAGFYGSVALITTLVITARSEGRDLAFLRVQGFSRRQTVTVIGLRVLPVVLVAVAAGTALGWGTAVALGPNLDLSAFTGSSLGAPVTIGVRTLAALAVATLAAAALVVALAGAAARRLEPATILREVDL